MTKSEQAQVQGELTDELNAPYAEPSTPFGTPPGVDDAEFQKAMGDLESQLGEKIATSPGGFVIDLAEVEYQREWEKSEDAHDRDIERGESGEEDDDLSPEETYDRHWEEFNDAYDRAIERGEDV